MFAWQDVPDCCTGPVRGRTRIVVDVCCTCTRHTSLGSLLLRLVRAHKRLHAVRPSYAAPRPQHTNARERVVSRRMSHTRSLIGMYMGILQRQRWPGTTTARARRSPNATRRNNYSKVRSNLRALWFPVMFVVYSTRTTADAVVLQLMPAHPRLFWRLARTDICACTRAQVPSPLSRRIGHASKGLGCLRPTPARVACTCSLPRRTATTDGGSIAHHPAPL